MRISTSMIFQTGVSTLQKQTQQLVHTQQQVLTGRRILSPSDDPIAAARALEVSQAQSLNKAYVTNQGAARDSLGLVENKLAAVEDIVISVRTRAVEAGSGSLAPSDLKAIATDVRASFDAMLSLANSQNGTGEFIFSGYQADTQPFTGNLNGVSYQGDDGQRTLQLSPTRIMSVSNAGSEVFNGVRAPAGKFFAVPGSPNGGTGYVADAQTTGTYDGTRYNVAWDGSNFNVTNAATGAAVVSQSGPTLTFGAVQLEMAGTPSAGDVFEVAPRANVFNMYTNMVRALENPPATGGLGGAVEPGHRRHGPGARPGAHRACLGGFAHGRSRRPRNRRQRPRHPVRADAVSPAGRGSDRGDQRPHPAAHLARSLAAILHAHHQSVAVQLPQLSPCAAPRSPLP